MFFIDCAKCDAVYGGSPRDARSRGWIVGLAGDPDLCPACAPVGVPAAATSEQFVAPPEVVGFDRPEHGSADRYKDDRKIRPWRAHTFWWFVHNAVAHPLIAVLPFKPFFSFHDWTSEKMHGQ